MSKGDFRLIFFFMSLNSVGTGSKPAETLTKPGLMEVRMIAPFNGGLNCLQFKTLIIKTKKRMKSLCI